MAEEDISDCSCADAQRDTHLIDGAHPSLVLLQRLVAKERFHLIAATLLGGAKAPLEVSLRFPAIWPRERGQQRNLGRTDPLFQRGRAARAYGVLERVLVEGFDELVLSQRELGRRPDVEPPAYRTLRAGARHEQVEDDGRKERRAKDGRATTDKTSVSLLKSAHIDWGQHLNVLPPLAGCDRGTWVRAGSPALESRSSHQRKSHQRHDTVAQGQRQA